MFSARVNGILKFSVGIIIFLRAIDRALNSCEGKLKSADKTIVYGYL